VDEDRQPGAAGAGDSLKEPPGRGIADDAATTPAPDPLPNTVRRKLDATADAWLRCSAATTDGSPQLPVIVRRGGRLGWIAAAACFVLAVAGWWPRLVPGDSVAGVQLPWSKGEVARGRAQLLHEGGDHLGRWSWTHESGLSADVRGEVLWDGERQEGYLTIAGLEPTAGSGQQFQLWIFDATRDERYPVDGGVFDVPAGGQPVTVRIRPARPVAQAVAFAVTREPAGGVVVSDRSHLVALARTGAN
jgi:Anti-sigma-K factor rskA